MRWIGIGIWFGMMIVIVVVDVKNTKDTTVNIVVKNIVKNTKASSVNIAAKSAVRNHESIDVMKNASIDTAEVVFAIESDDWSSMKE